MTPDPSSIPDGLDLPDHWENGRLERYIERPEYGFTDSASDDASGTKFLRITDIQAGQVDWSAVPYCDCPSDVIESKRLLPGDIVVARIGATTGKSFFIDAPPRDAVFASYLIRLRANAARLLPRFLYLYMQTTAYWAHVDRHKGDRLKGGVNIPVLESLPVVVPSVDDQSRIVQVLDCIHAAARSEAAQARVAADLRNAATTELFRCGLRGEATKESEIGSLPTSWVVAPFEQALTIAQGQVDPKVEPFASLFHIGPEDVEPNTGRILTCRTAKELGLISGKYHFREGDIVYSKIRPYLNKVVMPAFEGVCSADMYPMRALEGFDARFLFHYLLSESFLRQAVPHQLRTGIPKINREQLSDTAFPRPSLEEQREIAAILDALNNKFALHMLKQAAFEELFNSLLHKLISGEVRVDSLDLSGLAVTTPSSKEASA